jgi:hypothetical protein
LTAFYQWFADLAARGLLPSDFRSIRSSFADFCVPHWRRFWAASAISWSRAAGVLQRRARQAALTGA